jgi:hypothetical protein
MAARKLEILTCNEVYRGQGSKGEYVIYEVEAKDPNTGIMVNVPLRSFSYLDTGLTDTFEVEKYEKQGRPTTYTLKRPRQGGGGNGALGQSVDALRGRVDVAEQNIDILQKNVANLQQMVERMAQGQPVASSVGAGPVPTPSSTGSDFGGDDDIPF